MKLELRHIVNVCLFRKQTTSEHLKKLELRLIPFDFHQHADTTSEHLKKLELRRILRLTCHDSPEYQ